MSITVLGVIEYMKKLNQSRVHPTLKYDGALIVATTAVHRYNEPVVTVAQVKRMIAVQKFNLGKIEGEIKEEPKDGTTKE